MKSTNFSMPGGVPTTSHRATIELASSRSSRVALVVVRTTRSSSGVLTSVVHFCFEVLEGERLNQLCNGLAEW
jgi:hypothetical protein